MALPFFGDRMVDLELKDLDSFRGTQRYHQLFPCGFATDGVQYVMDNGYSWLVTDALAAILTEPRLKREEFLVIQLRLPGEQKGIMEISDGNGNILYTQRYEYTNAKREVKLWWTDNVMLLPGEY